MPGRNSGFWFAGLGLFEQAESMVSDPSDKQHLRSCITKAREHLHEVENQPETNNRDNRGYLFEGHLTVNPEPPQPAWMAQSNLMSTVAALMASQSSQNAVENSNKSESVIPEFRAMDVAHCYLDGNADAVEFCPHDSFHGVLAVATYTLQEGDKPSRNGSISLFDVDAEMGRLELFHRVDTAGIFDIKWNPQVGGSNSSPLLAQADADGYMKLHGFECGSNGTEGRFLREIDSVKVSSSMCLFVDWNPSATSISVGLSDGSISIVSFTESKLDIQQEWKAHDFELWTTSFDIHQPQLVYTGSDDCRFCCWDLRDSPSKLVFQNSKSHKMGVCSIAKSPDDPNTLLTGSYDEYLRVWDVRSISKPVNETSICLGGGVWRIKHHPFVPGVVLAACMHGGFAVVKAKGEKAEVIETYSKHGSLAYGADWHKGLAQEGKRMSPVVATCSFYDRLLRIWMPENDIIA